MTRVASTSAEIAALRHKRNVQALHEQTVAAANAAREQAAAVEAAGIALTDLLSLPREGAQRIASHIAESGHTSTRYDEYQLGEGSVIAIQTQLHHSRQDDHSVQTEHVRKVTAFDVKPDQNERSVRASFYVEDDDVKSGYTERPWNLTVTNNPLAIEELQLLGTDLAATAAQVPPVGSQA